MINIDLQKCRRGIHNLEVDDIFRIILSIHSDMSPAAVESYFNQKMKENALVKDSRAEDENRKPIKIGHYKYLLIHWTNYRKQLFEKDGNFIAADVLTVSQFEAFGIAPFLVANKIIYLPTPQLGVIYDKVIMDKEEVIYDAYKKLVAETMFMDLLTEGKPINILALDDKDTYFEIYDDALLQTLQAESQLLQNTKHMVLSLLKNGSEEKMKRRYEFLVKALQSKSVGDLVNVVELQQDSFEKEFVEHYLSMLQSKEEDLWL